MTTFIRGLLPVIAVALALPTAAFAQSSDAKVLHGACCQVPKRFLDQNPRFGSFTTGSRCKGQVEKVQDG